MTITVWDARLIDGLGGPPRERTVVSIEDGRITAVVEASGDRPPDAIDLAGRTLMPGLIDAHAHLSSDTDRSPGFGPGAGAPWR